MILVLVSIRRTMPHILQEFALQEADLGHIHQQENPSAAQKHETHAPRHEPLEQTERLTAPEQQGSPRLLSSLRHKKVEDLHHERKLDDLRHDLPHDTRSCGREVLAAPLVIVQCQIHCECRLGRRMRLDRRRVVHLLILLTGLGLLRSPWRAVVCTLSAKAIATLKRS